MMLASTMEMEQWLFSGRRQVSGMILRRSSIASSAKIGLLRL